MERTDRSRVRPVQPGRGRSEAPPRALPARIGNHAFTRMVSRLRDGEGILENGTVHPDVAAAIAATRGTGSGLPSALEARFSKRLGSSLKDVRVHADARSDALARAVSARAFTMGTDIYFARGEYNPGTPAGDRLIAHELGHTEQQRGAAAAAGPMAVSNPGDALELEADNIARDLLA